MTALLALHIESALDPAETDLVRSMSRLSISQTMLLLAQAKDVPVVKRALPIFEDILATRNLQQNLMHSKQEGRSVSTGASVHAEQYEADPVFNADLLGFDFLDDWQIGQMDLFSR